MPKIINCVAVKGTKILPENCLRKMNRRSRSSATVDSEIKVGDIVYTNSTEGVVQFKGETSFADGIWLGVCLRTKEGKNDGSVQGVRYFQCEAGYGTFLRESQVIGKLDSTNSTETADAHPKRNISRKTKVSKLPTVKDMSTLVMLEFTNSLQELHDRV
jgi:dynactin complex subunit